MNSLVKILVLLALIIAGGAGLVFWKSKVTAHGGGIEKVTKEQMEMLAKDLNPMQQRMLAQGPEQKKALANNLKEFLAISNQARKEGFAERPEIKQELKYIEKAILALTYDKVKNGDKPMPPLSMVTQEQIVEFWGEDPNKKSEDESGDKENPDAQPEGPQPAPDADEPGPKLPNSEEGEPEAKDGEADSEDSNEPKANKLVIYESDKGFIDSIFSALGLSGVHNRAKQAQRKAEFKKFMEAQLALEEKRGMRPPGQEMSEEQVKQLKDSFARFSIYAEEAKAKLKTYEADARKTQAEEIAKLDKSAADFEEKKKAIDENAEAEIKKWKEFGPRAEFQTKLQQAQLLAQFYAQEKLVPKLDVKEEEVKTYIEGHPELVKDKKDKAEEILKKAKEGGDFAELAKENSTDPGSKDKGGLYEKVPKGQMVAEFEKAALALEPGQIAPELVQTKFGFHIIKLEKKGEKSEQNGQEVETYDVRHILIATSVKDESSPLGQEIPLEAFVMNKLKQERQDKILKEIMEANPVEVAEDFEVTPPPVPQQPQLPPQLQQQLQQQQQRQQPPPPAKQ